MTEAANSLHFYNLHMISVLSVWDLKTLTAVVNLPFYCRHVQLDDGYFSEPKHVAVLNL